MFIIKPALTVLFVFALFFCVSHVSKLNWDKGVNGVYSQIMYGKQATDQFLIVRRCDLK